MRYIFVKNSRQKSILMENFNLPQLKSENTKLKGILALVSIALLASLFYNYKLNSDSKKEFKALETRLLTEKESVLKELTEAKDSLNLAISSNTTLSEELMFERDKVEKMILEVKNTKDESTNMKKYVYESKKLKETVANLLKQVELLTKQNSKLTQERDSTATVLYDSRKVNDTLLEANSKMNKVIEKASKLSIVNLQTQAVKQKSSGKQVETEKASRADMLKISFTIAENQVAKSGDKNYYIQIIDPKNNIIGDKKSILFGVKTLVYSFVTSVKYENKTVEVSKDVPVKDIVEGSYFVNIFDKGELVSKTSFTLK